MRRNFAIGMLLACAPAAAWSQAISDFGRLPGGTWLFASAISDDGSVVVGAGDIPGDATRAVRWTTAAGLTILPPVAGGVYSSGHGISGDGLTAVGVSGSAYDVAARWTQPGGAQSLGSLSPGQPSFAFDASHDGSVIVGDGYLASGAQRAFRWTAAAGLQPFAQLLPGTNHSVALTVSSDGAMAAGFCFNNAPALVWPSACTWDSGGTVVSLGVLPGMAWSVPSDTNADGSVVIGYCALSDGSNPRAFRWSAAGGMQDLGLLPGAVAAVAGGVTADGAIVSGHCWDGTADCGFIWTAADGMLDVAAYLQARGFNTAGWTLRTAAICADGSALTGWGVHNGQNTSWHVSLGCIPPTISANPQSQSVTIGSQATITVLASGSALQYQWYKDSTAISGANAFTITIASVTPADAGLYFCRVSNACGAADSAAASLTVQGGRPCPGDLDEDGDVDLADLATLLAHFGEPDGAALDDGDLDADGDIDLSDLSQMLAAFGTLC